MGGGAGLLTMVGWYRFPMLVYKVLLSSQTLEPETTTFRNSFPRVLKIHLKISEQS